MKVILSRLLSPFVTIGMVWLAARGFSIDLPVEDVVMFLVAIILAISGAVHKLIDRKVHPADDAV